MYDFNRVYIMGRLTRDPELRATPSGQNVCTFSVATNRVFKDRNNEKKEQVEFHSVVIFGVAADRMGNRLKKGDGVFVEGRLQTRTWEDKAGAKHFRTEIVGERVSFLPSSSEKGSDGAIPTDEEGIPERPF